MQIKKNYILISVCAAVLLSCTSGYLEEPGPTASVAPEVVYGSEEGTQAFLAGIYRRFRDQWADNTNVGGLYSIFFARENKGTVTVIPSASWYFYDYQYMNREPNYTRTRETWAFLYYCINQFNTLIRDVEAKGNYTETIKNRFMAEGRALRAYFYLQLALEYDIAYPFNPNEPAPPIYRTPTAESKAMSTLNELYAFINEDLDYALQYMDENRVDKSYLNLTVVKAIKVQTLMAMNEQWDVIERLSQEIYKTVDEALAGDYKDGFGDAAREDWLWAMIQTAQQSNYYYAAPSAFSGLGSYYNNVFISKKFAESFSAGDVRNTFVKNNNVAPNAGNLYSNTKYKFAFDVDMLIMRKAEFLLAHIEALYHQGKKTEAHDLLFQLQQKRDPNAVKSLASGTDLLDEILKERVKELYLEQGVEWFDAKRLQRGYDREGSNHTEPVTITPNDVRLELKIPQQEIDANPYIDASVNNNR